MSTLLLLLSLLAPASLPAATLAELAQEVARPRIYGPSIATSGPGEFSIGRLRLAFEEGEVFPVRAGDRRVGLFFVGRGSFHYVADDPLTAESFELNVRRASQFAADGGLMSGELEAALVLDSRMTESIGEDTTPVPEAVARDFTRHLDRFDNIRRLALENRLAQALIDPSGGDLVAIQMQTNKDDLLFLHDGVRHREATIFSTQRYAADSALRGQRYLQPLATRPLEGDWLQREPPRFTLRHVDFDLLNRDEVSMALELDATFEIHARLQSLGLSLWSEVFHRRRAHQYVLESVSAADGTPLAFSHRDGDLVVQLPRIAEPGERLALHFSTRGDVLRRPGGHSYWWLPIGSWLPMPPRFDASAFTVHGVVRVAPPFVPFGMGRTVRRWNEDGLACLEFELAEPVQFAVVLAGKYHSYSETRVAGSGASSNTGRDQTITLSSYAFAQEQPMKQVSEQVFGLIEFYEGLLGDFPYRELSILEINAFGFGIAPPGVVYLTAEGFDPGPTGRSFRREPNMRLAHEIAHMWWGHQAQMRAPEDQWLSESIAEYMAAVALDGLIGPSRFKDALRDWQKEAGDSKSLSSIYMANRLVGERAAFDRRNLLYAKGPLMLHALREEIGDQAFFSILRELATTSPFDKIDTAQFIELTNRVTGSDHSEFFRTRLFGLD